MRDTRSGMNYRDLEIWKLAREAAVAVHRMTLRELPKFEMHEEASQIRRSFKSIRSNIVEGYRELQTQLDLLGRKPNVFIKAVEREHISHLASRISHPGS